MAYVAPPEPGGGGPAPDGRVPDPRRQPPDELLDVPPVSERSMTPRVEAGGGVPLPPSRAGEGMRERVGDQGDATSPATRSAGARARETRRSPSRTCAPGSPASAARSSGARSRSSRRRPSSRSCSTASSRATPPSGRAAGRGRRRERRRLSRRRFLQLSSASLALAGLTACTRQPLEKIVPYVKQPEELVPGVPLYFATAATLGGYATGVLVESHMGRPTKIEGNPEHPASLGATDALTQAAILGLYDPDRSQIAHLSRRHPHLAGVPGGDRARCSTAQRGLQGEGCGCSPARSAPADARRSDPEVPGRVSRSARWHQWEPAGRGNAAAGARAAFGQPVEAHYDLAQADVVLALESDFLTQGPGAVRYARDFADRRRAARRGARHEPALRRRVDADPRPARWPTIGWRSRRARSRRCSLELAAALGAGGGGRRPLERRRPRRPARSATAPSAGWLAAVARDLAGPSAGARWSWPGTTLPPAAHALAHAINARARQRRHDRPLHRADRGRARSTRRPRSPSSSPTSRPAASTSSSAWARTRSTTRPPISASPMRIQKVARCASISASTRTRPPSTATGTCRRRTGSRRWGDARRLRRHGDDPAAAHRAALRRQVGARAAGGAQRRGADGLALVQAYWQDKIALGDAADAEAAWRRALHDGVVPETAPRPRASRSRRRRLASAAAAARARRRRLAEPSSSRFRPDPAVGDGRYANNGWLQELPRAAHQADLGQRAADGAGTRRAAGPGDRGRRRAARRRWAGRAACACRSG